ncbi:AP-5 complex subunit sigma-1-like [Lytechinus pictus]|uniref:AP-5 complex subunit sigma-1-like n=1 Tax=Lytechinus pictus TaxID=7653 RepID=UPI0030B9D642
MVYAFIIHTLPPDTCRVLFSCTFGFENAKLDERSIENEGAVTEMRTLRKEQMALVARQVQSEFSFQKAVSERVTYSDGLSSGQDDLLRDAELGMFRLAAGDPFKTEKIAVWLGVGKTGFILVCETHENRLQVENQLRLLVKNLQEHVKAVRQPTEVLEKGDRVMEVLHHFLPSGRIIFMNHALIKQTEKELDIAMKLK